MSADKEVTEKYVNIFSKLEQDENLSPEQNYNADETAFFWHCTPRNILAVSDECDALGEKEVRDRVTVLLCANVAGTHKCKLSMIVNSAHPRAPKGMKVLPLVCKGNKQGWIT